VMLDVLFHANLGDFDLARLVDHDGALHCQSATLLGQFAGLCGSRWVMRAAHITPLQRCGSKRDARWVRGTEQPSG
jgi:hypothetical protein